MVLHPNPQLDVEESVYVSFRDFWKVKLMCGFHVEVGQARTNPVTHRIPNLHARSYGIDAVIAKHVLRFAVLAAVALYYAVVRRYDGFRGVFSGETGAGPGASRIENERGYLIWFPQVSSVFPPR